MFLEINDKNKNDIVVYSQNIFDPEENFRIIFKEGFEKKHKKISYTDVCGLINFHSQKNLIVYRLLTNDEKIDAADSKYGLVLMIDNKAELIYFDPVFALKDLNNLVKNFNMQSFRFKIQQLGIKTLSYINERENFTEIYSYDLHAIEAQNQNDKIFADALYADDWGFLSNEEFEPFTDLGNRIENVQPEHTIVENINEFPTEKENSLNKANTGKIIQKPSGKVEQKELLKKLLGIEERNDKLFPDDTDEKGMEEIDLTGHNSYTSLFKSTGKKQNIEEREKNSIILKLTIT